MALSDNVFKSLDEADWGRISDSAHKIAAVTPSQHKKKLWSGLAFEFPDDIRAKVDYEFTARELQEAFSVSKPHDYQSVLRCCDDAFYAVRVLKGDDVADGVLEQAKAMYRDLEVLSTVDVDDLKKGQRMRFVNEFEKSFEGSLDDDVSAVLFKHGKRATVMDVLPNYITDEERQFEGEHNCWESLRQNRGDQIADLVIGVAKNTFIEGLHSRKSAAHIVDDIREKLGSVGLPEEDQAILFKGSFVASCLELLPQYFDEQQNKILAAFPLANEDGEKISTRYEMPNLRLSAGGFAAAMAAEAGDNGPGAGQRYHHRGGSSKRTGRANREPATDGNDFG